MLAGDARGLGAVGGVELVEDGRDVVFDGAFGQHQARGDFAVAEPVGQQAQHVDLALAEQLVFGCGWRVAAREFGDQAGGDAGLNDAFTSMDLADCGQQFVGGQQITISNVGGSLSNSFTISINLPSDSAGRSFLLGTAGLAAGFSSQQGFAGTGDASAPSTRLAASSAAMSQAAWRTPDRW